MNFQSLLTVESYDFYLDLAFRNARLKVDMLAQKRTKKTPVEKKKHIEMERIKIIQDSLKRYLNKIISSFPQIDELPPVYIELIRCTLDYKSLKKSLGAIGWVIRKTDFFSYSYLSKLSKTRNPLQVGELRREYIGRISSLLKQIKAELEYLEEARKIMKKYPTFKTSLRTVTIFGFPNVGKTTLLYRLTGSKPEINSYPFTTKSINISYFKKDDEKIQIIDTPGTLNRFNRMNDIEKQAHLVLKYLADTIIYVFDLTGSFPITDQLLLYHTTMKLGKKVIVYFSKEDLIGKNEIKDFIAENNILGVTSVVELKKSL